MNAVAAEDAPKPRLARPMSEAEAAYMQGGAQPAAPSFMFSNSKFLNSPLFRDAWAQVALRRYGPDLPVTYDLPTMFRAIYDVTDLDAYVAAVAAEKAQNPEFRTWLNARKLSCYRLEARQDHAPGTLGAALRELLSQPGMQLQFMATGEVVDNDLDYILKRRGQTHDIEHFITGFGPNNLGEHALALFNNVAVSNYFSPELAHHLSLAMAFVTSASLMRNALHYPAAMPHLYEATRRAIDAGLAVKKPLFLVDWDAYLDWTLEDICAEFGIARNNDAAWRDLDHLTRG
jgi:ubiquinone biosynthesis protein Coq4